VSAKIKLEKVLVLLGWELLCAFSFSLQYDLAEKRTCMLGLHGPWRESSSVFIRITFTFPKDYLNNAHPQGTLSVELERNTLISLKNRTFILRKRRAIREQKRPCLEACLCFLSEGETSGARRPMDSESSSEGEDHVSRKSRDLTVSLLRSHKNLAEPLTSLGTFGPNGALRCSSLRPSRLTGGRRASATRRGLRATSCATRRRRRPCWIFLRTHDSIDTTGDHPPPRVFRSPALMVGAVHQLSLAATDRIVKPLDSRWPYPAHHGRSAGVLA
jgi:hypothetical protein